MPAATPAHSLSHRPDRLGAGIVRSRAVAGALAACPLALAAMFAMPAESGAVDCPLHELRVYTDAIQPIPATEMVPTHGPGDAMAPPEDPDVGDSWLWYTWKLAGFPVAEQKMCTVRGEGTNVYIVVEDSQWGTNVDQADVDAMLEAWDSSSLGNWPDMGIYELTSANFGPVPDQLDNDPKVYVLYYDFDVTSDGFFWAFDMFPDGSQQFASNETEVLYMNSSEFDPGGDYLISVQAHEFQHMIHWLGDSNESSWVNEGCSELAMWLYGLPDQVVAFPSQPDNSLTQWNGNFADYVKTYLWTLYFYERYGGQATILDLVAQPANSIAGVEIALDNAGYTESFAQVVSDWYVANYLDDPSFGDGRYGYVGEDLPTFASVTKSTYPIDPTNANVNHWAADYIRLISLSSPQSLAFDGGDTSDWTARVVRRLAGATVSVDPIPLDGVDFGTFPLPSMGAEYDEAIVVVGNISNAGVTTYQYSTDDDPTSAPHLPGAGSGLALQVAGPNPFSGDTALSLRLVAPATAEVTLHAADGRRVRTLASGEWGAGLHSIPWDGRDDLGRELAAGSYWVRVETAAGEERAVRLVRLD